MAELPSIAFSSPAQLAGWMAWSAKLGLLTLADDRLRFVSNGGPPAPAIGLGRSRRAVLNAPLGCEVQIVGSGAPGLMSRSPDGYDARPG
jgi:hypothetical protein